MTIYRYPTDMITDRATGKKLSDKLTEMDGQLVSKASKRKVDNIWVDIKEEYGVSGNITTTKGNTTANANTITVTDASNFQVGGGVVIYGAGANSAAPTPTNVTVAPQGTAGTSTYSYVVIASDVYGGASAGSSVATTTTGNATLDKTNYNQISFTKSGGTITTYGIYRTAVPAGSSLQTGFIGWHYDTPFKDIGYDVKTPPRWLSQSTPPTSPTVLPFSSTITAINGKTLTLTDTAKVTLSNVDIYKNDSAIFSQAMNDLDAKGGGTLYIPNGDYYVSGIKPKSNVKVIGGTRTKLWQFDFKREGVFWHNDYPNNVPLVDNFQLHNIIFEGDSTSPAAGSNYQCAMQIEYGSNIVVKNCTIRNFVCGGLHILNTVGVWVEDNKFYNIGTAFLSNGQGTWNGLTISTSSTDTYNVASTVGGYYISGNLFETGETGAIVLQSFIGSGNRAIVTNNIIRNWKNWAGIYVECGYGREVTISNNQTYECLTGIGIGDTSGTANSQTTQKISDIVVSNNFVECLAVPNSYGISTQASRFTISGNTVKVIGCPIYAVALNRTTVTAKQFVVTGNSFVTAGTSLATSMLLANLSYLTSGIISNNSFVVEDNCFGGAVYIQGDQAGSGVEGLVFSSNLIRGANQIGLVVKDSNNCTISNNTVLDTGVSGVTSRYGIFVNQSKNISVISNVVRDTRATQYMDNAINVAAGCTSVFIENNIFGAMTGGIGAVLAGLSGANSVIARNNEGFNPWIWSITPATPVPLNNTMYQNTQGFDVTVYIPVYATTPGTSGTVIPMCNSTNTQRNYYTEFVSGSTTSSAPHVVKIRVPSGWYYGVNCSGLTIGTSTMFAL